MPRKPIDSMLPTETVVTPSVKELFLHSWELVRSVAKTFVGVWLVQLGAGVGLMLLSGITGAVGAQFLEGTFQFLGVTLLILAVVVFVVALFVLVWGTVAQFFLAYTQVAGKPNFGVKGVYRESKRFVGKYLITGLLVGLVTGIGMLFLILPGLVFGVIFGFSVFLLYTDNLGVLASMRESKRLVKGRFWFVVKKVLGIVGINIVSVLVQMVLSIVPVAGTIGGFILSIFMSFITTVYSFLLLQYLKKQSDLYA